MDISGSYTLSAPREQVWNALLDPDTLKRALPGCESAERTGDNDYAVRLNVDVAGVKGAYNSSLHVLNAQRPDSYRVIVDSTGVRGILHGDGVVRLEAKDTGTTVVHYSGQAQLGGAIAGLGVQVASGAANLLIRQYFTRLENMLPAAPVMPPETPRVSETPVAPYTPVPEPVIANIPASEPEAVTATPPPPVTESNLEPVAAQMPPPTAPLRPAPPPARRRWTWWWQRRNRSST